MKLFTKVYVDALIVLTYDGSISLLKLGGGMFDGPLEGEDCDDKYEEDSNVCSYCF